MKGVVAVAGVQVAWYDRAALLFFFFLQLVGLQVLVKVMRVDALFV